MKDKILPVIFVFFCALVSVMMYVSPIYASNSSIAPENEPGCENASLLGCSFSVRGRAEEVCGLGESVFCRSRVTASAESVCADGGVFIAFVFPCNGFDAVFLSKKKVSGYSYPLKISADKPYPAVLPEFRTGSDGKLYLLWLGYDGGRYVDRMAILEDGEWVSQEFVPTSYPESSAAAWELDWNKYVGFGDSVTAGARRVEWDGDGYRSPLQNRLMHRLNPLANVVTRGIGGERTVAGVNRIDSVLREEKAGYILIMEGINDLADRISKETILFNLQEMVRKSISFGTVPVLAMLPPRADSREAHMGETLDFNMNYLKPYIEEQGILTADHWKYFTEKPDWRDFMDPGDQHPNPAGYDLLAEAWFVALEPDAPPAGFTGWTQSGCVVLAWEENTEYGHAGYNVYRSIGQVGGFKKLNGELLTEPFFRDCEPPEGYLYYAAVAVDRNGNESDFSDFFVLDESSNGMCFVVSAAYGSPLSDEVRVLSRFRDVCLLDSRLSRRMVDVYYKLGPAAAVLTNHSPAAAFVRIHLKPVVRTIRFFFT